MSEDLGGIEWDSIRLTWTSPAVAVDSYIVKYSTSGTISEGNWASSTTATTTFASIKGPNTTQNCTVTGLTENQNYYFAVKSSKTGCSDSAISNCVSATARQPKHDVGDWWLWKEFYNCDASGNVISDQSYLLADVIQTDTSVNIYYNREDDYTPESASSVARLNLWNDERRVTTDAQAWGRSRIVWAPIVTNAKNVMHHQTVYCADDDFTWPIRVDALAEAYSGLSGNGDHPSNQYYYVGTHATPNATAWSSSCTEGYPYFNGKAFSWYEFIHAEPTLAESATSAHRHWYYDKPVTAGAWIPSYDVSTASADSWARGIGTYGVWPLSQTNTWTAYGGQSPAPPVDADTTSIWYSPEVHNYVRKLEQLALQGYEDSAIAYYENRDFQTSGFTVTHADNTVDVSITITNILDENCNFNILCMVIDKDAVTPTNGKSYAAYGAQGDIMFPNLDNINATLTWTDGSNFGSSTLLGSVKKTGNLAPGASATLTWTDCYTTDGTSNWIVWCAGQSVTW